MSCPRSKAWLVWLERSTTSTPPLSTGTTLCWSSMRFSRSSPTSSYSLVCRATSCSRPPASSGPSPPLSKDIVTLLQSPLTLLRRTGSSRARALLGDNSFSQGVRRHLSQGAQYPPGGGQDRGDLPQFWGGWPGPIWTLLSEHCRCWTWPATRRCPPPSSWTRRASSWPPSPQLPRWHWCLLVFLLQVLLSRWATLQRRCWANWWIWGCWGHSSCVRALWALWALPEDDEVL